MFEHLLTCIYVAKQQYSWYSIFTTSMLYIIIPQISLHKSLYCLRYVPFKRSIVIFSDKVLNPISFKAAISLFQVAVGSTSSQYWNIFVQHSSTFLGLFASITFNFLVWLDPSNCTPRSFHFVTTPNLTNWLNNAMVGLSEPKIKPSYA